MTTQPNTTATPTPTPTAPAAPNYAKPDQIVQVKVDGKTMDLPVEQVARSYQMTSAAEKRLQEANTLYNSNRATVDAAGRLEQHARSLGVDPSLLKTNPEAALREMAKRLNPAGSPGASSQGGQDDDSDPRLAALQSQIATLAERLNSTGSQVTNLTNSQASAALNQQLDAALSAYPLFNNNAHWRDHAKKITAATMLADPGMSLQEAVGSVHKDIHDGLSFQVTQERDSRANAAARNVGLPPGMGQPGMSMPESPTFSQEDRRAGKVRGWLKDQVGRSFGNGR